METMVNLLLETPEVHLATEIQIADLAVAVALVDSLEVAEDLVAEVLLAEEVLEAEAQVDKELLFKKLI